MEITTLDDYLQMIGETEDDITNTERIKYNLYAQGFKSISDLVKKRDANGKQKPNTDEINLSEKDADDVLIERYNRYLAEEIQGKPYNELCTRLGIPKDVSLLEQGNIREFRSLLQEEGISLRSSKKRKPSKSEIQKRIEFAKKAPENVKDRQDEEDLEQLISEQREELEQYERFNQYISKFPIEGIKKVYRISFIFNAEKDVFLFINQYTFASQNSRKFIRQALHAMLDEHERAFCDDWTRNCFAVTQNINNSEAYPDDLSKIMCDSWGWKYIDVLDELNSFIQKIFQFSDEDWENIVMYYQLWINNAPYREKIKFAISWLLMIPIQ